MTFTPTPLYCTYDACAARPEHRSDRCRMHGGRSCQLDEADFRADHGEPPKLYVGASPEERAEYVRLLREWQEGRLDTRTPATETRSPAAAQASESLPLPPRRPAGALPERHPPAAPTTRERVAYAEKTSPYGTPPARSANVTSPSTEGPVDPLTGKTWFKECLDERRADLEYQREHGGPGPDYYR
jgi:hypothetical protein